jgi:hypothetical protein
VKKNGFAPLIIILVVVILGVVGYFVYSNLSKQKTVDEAVTSIPTSTIAPSKSSADCSNKNSAVGLYESGDLNLSFNYPIEWGNACSSNEFFSGASLSSDYIKFEKSSSLFVMAGDIERGGVIDGVNLELFEKTKLTTSDGHKAEIDIYKTAEDTNQNWIEAMVLTKETGSGFSPEVFYIKVVGYRDQNTVLQFKDQFYKLLSSFKFTK